MTSRFRWPHEPAKAKPEPEPAESPAALLRGLAELVGFVNQNAGRLPVESVVAARRVTDAVRDVIDTAENGTLDIYAALSVNNIVTDYLPTTLHAYLALDADAVETPRPDGSTPRQSLLDQVNSLWSGVSELRAAAQARDGDALVSHGNFLHAKFTGSDLDL